MNKPIPGLEIKRKYHETMVKTFYPTEPIETALRKVALYKTGYRTVWDIPLEEYDIFEKHFEDAYKFLLDLN